MKLTRRNFLAWAGLSAVGAVACEGFGIREGEFSLQSPARLPEDLVRGKDNWYATLCRTCPSHEGIIVRVMEGRAKKVQGNPLYPTNLGKQSARCEGGLQGAYHPDRLSGPMRRTGPRGSGHFAPIPRWEDALDLFKSQLGPRRGKVLAVTEPLRGHMALVVNRFARAMGGRHLAFEALDNLAYRAAVKNVFRQDVLPDFDLANTNFLLSFGADFLSTWVSPTRWGREYGEFRQGVGRKRGTFFHVDPRFSMTAANADQWVPIRPGWEGHLALSLAYVIISEGLQAPGVDVGALTGGRGASALEAFNPEAAAGRIGIPGDLAGGNPVEFIRGLARSFAQNGPSLAIGGGSAAAHKNGLFNLEAIYSLNYLAGSVGSQGGVRFNPESALPDLPAAAQVASLADWSAAAEDLRGGKTKMVLIHQADPVHGLPGSLEFQDALNMEDLYIVSFSPFLDDTSVMADLVLPDRVYLEDWGSDIPEPGPGYQVLGIQQPVINPLSDLDPRSFPDVLLAIAGEMGEREQLPWDSFQAMLKQSSRELFGLKRGSIDAGSADEFWTKMLQQGGWWDVGSAPAAPAGPPAGLFSGIAAKASPGLGPPGGLFHLVPFSHNTLLDGQNAHLPWLQAAPDPLTTIAWQTWVEMNDEDAKNLGVREGDLVHLESSQGSIRSLAYPTPAAPRGVVSVPLGQGRRNGSETATGRPGTEGSNVMEILEPVSVGGTGGLAWASTNVRVTPTGTSVKVSKFEGIVRAVEVGITPGERIIQTVPAEEL